MKTFAQFVVEAADLILSVGMFPIVASTTAGNKRLQQIINTINQAIADGTIPNARFGDLKFIFGRMFDDIQHENGSLYPVFSWAYRQNLEFYQPNHAAGKLKLTQKILTKEPNNKDAAMYAAFASEIALLQVAVEKVKALSVKRQSLPAEDPRQKYIAPMASKEAGRKVIAVLTELTDQIKVEYIKMVYERIENTVKQYFSLKINPTELMKFRRYNPEINMWSWHVYEKQPNGDPVAMKVGWEKYVQKEAEEAGEFMQEQFLAKNARKLAKIVELKENLQDCRIVGRAHVMQQGIGGEIAFTFTDGSGFVVKNGVKDNRSSAGKWFSQFPTTFHNVVMPDGKSMPSPSEQRMIEVFAVAKA